LSQHTGYHRDIQQGDEPFDDTITTGAADTFGNTLAARQEKAQKVTAKRGLQLIRH
jgi:hypothetical protein